MRHNQDDLGRLRTRAETIADEHAETQQPAGGQVTHRLDNDICEVIVDGFRLGGDHEAVKIVDAYLRRTNQHREEAGLPRLNPRNVVVTSQHQFPTATSDERTRILTALITAEG